MLAVTPKIRDGQKKTKKATTEIRSYLPKEMTHLVIFFGGFFDETFHPVKSFVDSAIGAKRYGETTGIIYFSWSDAAWWSDYARDQIAKVVPGSGIAGLALVGHSYGGHSATKVAGQLNLAIDALVTVDAVSWESALFWFGKPGGVAKWYNSYCSGVGDLSDVIAVAGGHWGHESGADLNLPVKEATHANFTKMFLAVEAHMMKAIGV